MKLTKNKILLLGVLTLIIGISVIILTFMTVFRAESYPWPILLVGGMAPPLWYITKRLEKDIEENNNV